MLYFIFIVPFLLAIFLLAYGYMEVKKNPPSERIFYSDIEQDSKNTCYTSKTSTGGRTRFLNNA